MYGIASADGKAVLCRGSLPDTYVMKYWYRKVIPVVRESAIEIDQLMQDYMTASGRYNLKVIRFSDEQMQEILADKLTGRYYSGPHP